jgi:hypothetical protein
MAEQSVKDTPETQGNQPTEEQNNQPKITVSASLLLHCFKV